MRVAHAIDDVARMAAKHATNGGIFACAGNGAGSAIALHMAADLARGGAEKSPPVRSLALGGNPALLSMWANDIGWDRAYQAILEPWLVEPLFLFLMSTSGGSGGKSANLIHVAQSALEKGATVVAVVGRLESPLGQLATRAIAPEPGDQIEHRQTDIENAISAISLSIAERVTLELGPRSELQS